jgi:flagellar basal-body rod protein FlgC
MNLFGLFQVSGSALSAERLRAEVVTTNLANAESTRTPEGGAYRRKVAVFESRSGTPFQLLMASSGSAAVSGDAPGGVRVSQVVDDGAPTTRKYEPGHPDADASGYVEYPNINPVQEMVDLMGAQRAYELNASAIQAAKQMIQQSIQILR